MSLRSLTLRVKLTLWYLLVFAGIQGVLLAVAIAVRGPDVESFAEAQLKDQAMEVADALRPRRTPWTTSDIEAALPPLPEGAQVWLRDQDGRVRYPPDGAVNAPPWTRPQPTTKRLLAPQVETLRGQVAREVSGSPDPLRLATVPFKEPGGFLLFVQVAAPGRFLGTAFDVFSDLLLLYLPIGLIAAACAAWLIAGRAVAPILQMSVAAAAVSPTNRNVELKIKHSDEEIARLNRSLNRAIGRMEAGYRAQEQFISNVSHELKTPISVILTEAQVLARGEAPLEEYEGWTLKVGAEMQRLGRLVESFLKLARSAISETPPRNARVAALDLVTETVEHCSPLARLHDVRLVPSVNLDDDGDASVIGDPDLLRTLLDNLICNAIRFSPRGSPVEIEAEVDRETMVFSVRDYGPGMPEEYLTRVFDRFVQAPSQSPRAQGTGLGLSIAHHIAQVHGGSVTARNNGDGGCSFEARLPLADETTPIKELEPQEAPERGVPGPERSEPFLPTRGIGEG